MMRKIKPQWQNARKILCLRLDNLGDVVMTTPAFRALKNLNLDANLTLLTSHRGAGVAPFIPDIDSVIEFNVPWVKLEAAKGDSEAVLALVERLRQEQFDAAVIFTVFSQSSLPAAMICYLAGIPLRLGHCRENPYNLLTDWKPDYEPLADIEHEVTRQLQLVESIGATIDNTRLGLDVSWRACGEALEKLSAAGVDPAKPWLVLHPGVSEKRRQYPAEKYAEAGRELVRRGIQIVVTGTASEKELAGQIVEAMGTGSVSLAGELPLETFIGLIAAAPLLISNNTGPVHIAAAVNTPVVVLYAHTNPQHTPWQVANRVLYFDVPEAQRSKNPLLVYTYQKTVTQPVYDAQPNDIVAAALELFQLSGAQEAVTEEF
jgi:lipopolysaccharide heptosyltransferase II